MDWKHHNVESLEEVKVICKAMRNCRAIGFDLETSGFEWWGEKDYIAGVGTGIYAEGIIYTYYFPVGHIQQEEGALPNLPPVQTWAHLQPVFTDPKITKITANGKFDAHFLRRVQGIPIENVQDVQVMARLLRSDYMKVTLNELMKKEFGVKHTEEDVLFKWLRKRKIKATKTEVAREAYAIAPAAIVGEYCGADVYWTMRLGSKYAEELKKDPALMALYSSVEKPLVQVVIEVEENGVRIDRGYLQEIDTKIVPKAKQLEQEVHAEANKVFDLASPAQAKEALIPLGVEPEMRERKRKDGTRVMTPSLDKDALEKYKEKFPVVKNLLLWRACTKFHGTYIEPLLASSAGTGFVHTSLKQDSARTGRFGCANPPLQTIPQDGEDMAEFSIREAFVPREGNVLLSIDYCQMEYRMLAHFCRDERLLDLFAKDLDFHTYVACKLFGTDEPTKAERKKAKTYNFAQLYGSGPDSISRKLGIPVEQVKKDFDAYKREFPGVIKWKYKYQDSVRRRGGVRNPFGRWRKLPASLSYIGVNTLIQGTCADVMKIAMIRVQKYLRGKKSLVLFPVHDELDIDYNPADGNVIDPIVEKMMSFEIEGKPMFKVPLEVEVSRCEGSWAHKRELDVPDILSLEVNRKLETDEVTEEEKVWKMQGDRVRS